MSLVCATCGKTHSDFPHIGSAAPYYWSEKFKADPACFLTEDLCVINNEDFFVRGCIEIPVHDHPEPFSWGVWVTHKKENFEIYRENPDSADIGPFFGWLSTQIDYYPISTINLQTKAFYQGGGLRPSIILRESDHPLAIHQRTGISLQEVWQIAHRYE